MNRSTLILVGLLIVLGVVAYFMMPSGKERETSYKTEGMNFSIDSASIIKIDFQSPGKSVTLENVGGTWMLTSPVRYAANTTNVTQLTGEIAKFKVGSLVSSNPDKQSLFQVDSTGSKLTVNDRSGKTISLVIGKMGPSYTEVYCRVPNSNDVYLGEGISSWTLTQEVREWRDKTIYKTIADSIKQIDVLYRKKNISLIREGSRWNIGKDTLAGSAMTSALNTLANLQAEDFVDTLQKQEIQAIIVRVSSMDQPVFDFFPQMPDSSRYIVHSSQSPQLFVVSKFTLQQLLNSIEKFTK